MGTSQRWLARLRPETRDRLLAAVLGVALAAIYGPWPVGPSFHGGGRWVAAATAVVGSALLVWRRRRPLTLLGLLGSAFAVSIVTRLDASEPLLFLTWVAIYGVPAYARPGAARLAGWFVVLATAAVVLLLGLGTESETQGGFGIGGALAATYVATAWLLGRYHGTRQAYLVELEQHAARLTRERDAIAGRAAAEERARIARELHDMLAHTMSGMVVLAGGARRIAEWRPRDAVAALTAIEDAGRRGMAETRLLLDTLRGNGSAATPRLSPRALSALTDRLTAAGLDVRLDTDETPAQHPHVVDAAAYRIVQEALTNTLRHARATTVTVHIRHRPDALEVRVTDDGTATPSGEPGHGLAGMRERARLLGGELTAGPAPAGGWTVHAKLPTTVLTRLSPVHS